ncbi:MAG: hypothetical protein ACD_20C00429G0018 [uncultured bacterium]|nr:MAG: hypothetical protein ACD_20C00429G0018 [uncultured bacterium]
MKKVFFVVNKLKEFNFKDLLEKYLSDVDVSVGECLPENTEDYDLIILWSYQKIIPNIKNKKNIILFHSSDLPEGKGWAPIYNVIACNKEYYTISGIFAVDKVDTGDVIVKAKFKILDNYTAEYIRKWDNEISIMLTQKILSRFNKGSLKGIKQEGIPTYYERRNSEDNEIMIDSKIIDNLNHFRACEKNHPAFFYYNGFKYNIFVETAQAPSFPEDIEVIFYGNTA